MKKTSAGSTLPRLFLLFVLILGAAATTLSLPQQVDAESDTLRLAGSPFFESLDPAIVTDMASTTLMRQVFRGLTILDAELQPIPGLAESWQISEDGRTYNFKLRSDSLFHDGRPVEAEDVAASFVRSLDPETTGGEPALLSGPTFLADIEGSAAVRADESNKLSGVTIISTDELEIELSEPQSTFLTKLASPPAMILDRFDTADADWWMEPNGSGPFFVDSFDPQSNLNLERFDDFSPQPAAVERVEIRLGADALQALNLYEAGEIDIAGVPPSGLDRVADPEGELVDELIQTPLLAVHYVAFRRDVEPLDDIKIREAIWYGFQRQNVATIGSDGWVVPANGFVPNGMLGVEQWPVEMPSYNLEIARQAIADSRYGAPEAVPPIMIYTAGDGIAASMRDAFARDLGLTVEVVQVEWSDFVESLARREVPAYEMFWYADYPDPESLLELLFGEGRPDNYVDYADSEFNELLEAASLQEDVNERIAIYSQAQQVLLDDFVLMPVLYGMAYTLVRPEVSGLSITPMGILYLDSVSVDD